MDLTFFNVRLVELNLRRFHRLEPLRNAGAKLHSKLIGGASGAFSLQLTNQLDPKEKRRLDLPVKFTKSTATFLNF